jgi:hypothetical protein
MRKIIVLLLGLSHLACAVTARDTDTQTTPSTFNKPYHVICHRGIEYITRQWGESSFTLAVDKNNKPIQCKVKE